jgi:flagellar hook-length control protein FliK
MNPVDINIKVVPEAASPATNSAAEIDEDTRSFEQVLSSQISSETEADFSAEIAKEDSEKVAQDPPKLTHSENSKAEVLIGMVTSQILHSERLQVATAEEVMSDETAPLQQSGTNAMPEQIKDQRLRPATQAVSEDASTHYSEIFLKASPQTGVLMKSGTDKDQTATLVGGLMTASFAENSLDSGVMPLNISPLNSAALLSTPTASAVFTIATNAIHTSISAPITSHAWGEQLVQQIKHFSLERIGLAEIQLTPQDLGPIRVEIALDKNEASIHFSAQHQETRDALSQHMNRLRESLAEVGMQLQSATTGSYSEGQAFSFFQQQARERNNDHKHQMNANQNAHEEEGRTSSITITLNKSTGRSSIDLFA